jgi:hypothetical protein
MAATLNVSDIAPPLLQSCGVAMLRGRETVRADHRLRTDGKAIRTQSAISYKNPTLSLLLTVTAFSVRMLLIRTENAVGARSAQLRSRHATALMTRYISPKFFTDSVST